MTQADVFDCTPIIWDAHYLPSEHPMHTGNPLLDALPEIMTDEQWRTTLFRMPEIVDHDLALPAHLRAYKILSLKRLFVPTAAVVKLGRRFDQSVRWGYEVRRPFSKDRVQALVERFEHRRMTGEFEPIVFGDEPPMCSLSAIGTSGMGKTTSIAQILRAYQQVIRHPLYENRVQIVWLKVETPRGGALEDLARNILRAFDHVLKTKHATVANNWSPAKMLALAADLARSHHVGVIVLDELQNLTAKKSGGRELLLNWLQELVNTIKIPVVLVGTFKAKNLVPELRHARRSCVLGSSVWEPLKKGPEFEHLMRIIWKFCWLRDHGPLSDEMLGVLYEETQGIRSFMVDMFVIAQLAALAKGHESIAPKAFKQVARHEFAPVQPALNALRSKDPARLRKLDDLMDFDAQDGMDRLVDALQARVSAVDEPRNDANLSLVAQATASVCSVTGVSEEDARRLVLRNASESHKTAAALCKAALAYYFDMQRAANEDGAAR